LDIDGLEAGLKGLERWPPEEDVEESDEAVEAMAKWSRDEVRWSVGLGRPKPEPKE